MFDVTNVIIAAALSIFSAYLLYTSSVKSYNKNVSDSSILRRVKLEKLEAKNQAEILLKAWIYGLFFFGVLTFNAATDLSHYPFWPRLLTTAFCAVILYLIVHTTALIIFRKFKNRTTQ